jgi:hypothetical protein
MKKPEFARKSPRDPVRMLKNPPILSAGYGLIPIADLAAAHDELPSEVRTVR